MWMPPFKYIPKPYGFWVNKKARMTSGSSQILAPADGKAGVILAAGENVPSKNKKVNSPLLCGIVVLLTKIQA